MLAYRRSAFEALARHLAVRRWAEDGLLDPQAASALLARFPQPFYTPNVFIRIGLFVFGFICASSGLGLTSLATLNHGRETQLGIALLVYGSLCLGLREFLARREPRPFFRAGLDEAAGYYGLGCVIAGLLILARFRGDPHAGLALFLAAVFALAALRYADSLLASLSLAALVFALLDAGRAFGEAGVFLLPPLVVAFAAAVALGCGRALRARALRPWTRLWETLRLLALLLAYAGGNYFVVRELGGALLGGRGAEIPFAGAFYAYTFAIPAAYIVRGLRKKDRAFLDAGLFAVAAAVLTYKRYHDVMSLETGLVLAGLALLATAWAALKAFRPPRRGISAVAEKRSSQGGLLDAESLAAWTRLGGAAPGKLPDGHQGGGGRFGGGGAQGGF